MFSSSEYSGFVNSFGKIIRFLLWKWVFCYIYSLKKEVVCMFLKSRALDSQPLWSSTTTAGATHSWSKGAISPDQTFTLNRILGGLGSRAAFTTVVVLWWKTIIQICPNESTAVCSSCSNNLLWFYFLVHRSPEMLLYLWINWKKQELFFCTLVNRVNLLGKMNKR